MVRRINAAEVGAVPDHSRYSRMLDLFIAMAVAAHPASTRSALALCRPALARKAEGEIATIDVATRKVRGRSTTITGRVTVFVGMARPAPGTASAHHLIRADYEYACVVRGGKVRKTTLSQGGN